MKSLIKWIILALMIFGLTFGGAYYYQQQANLKQGGAARSTAATTLKSLQEQPRLPVFSASFVAVVSGQPATLVPGVVRYEIDVAKIAQRDVKWDDKRKTLAIALPPLVLSAPEVDAGAIRAIDSGAAAAIPDGAEPLPDDAVRKSGEDEIAKLARGESAMALAREAARGVIERSFAMPLRAAGIKAVVKATFADEQG
ncbi:DUF4230 domain-containing protein [Sphingobium algorifonticola]|uniref:DUF4230 domain-containing protein n=1 Tax=Sphingobium algorifonticola TaxID=2008318 RepID=A0A437J6B2_9SPHN|nr:DUF4230 domain-containing protein [Sphingobium algorifonticola]RVT40679.1 DUF4230 domain-containing protein [Sphingobium algorifonticola]